MDKKINLIPEEFTIPVSLTKSSKLINKISIILQILLLMLTLLSISLFIYFSITLKQSNTSISSLKDEVASLEKTEQQFVLTKDKLTKISYVNSLKSADGYLNEYKKIKEYIQTLPELTVKEVEIDKESLTITVTSINTISILELLKSLPDNKVFKNILITTLNYNLQKGFLITIKYYGL